MEEWIEDKPVKSGWSEENNIFPWEGED